jgi:hypothetical protein
MYNFINPPRLQYQPLFIYTSFLSLLNPIQKIVFFVLKEERERERDTKKKKTEWESGWCFKIVKKNDIHETSFSRLRTQDPQTPGKLHEMTQNHSYSEKQKQKSLILHAPVLFPKRVRERVFLSVNAAQHSFKKK